MFFDNLQVILSAVGVRVMECSEAFTNKLIRQRIIFVGGTWHKRYPTAILNLTKGTPKPEQSNTPPQQPRQPSASDEKLRQEAAEQKAKEEAAKARQQNKQQATQRGNQRQGNSNKEVRGDHVNTTGGGGKAKENNHQNANARRAREQKAADEKNKKN